jgi:hypothetical protein
MDSGKQWWESRTLVSILLLMGLLVEPADAYLDPASANGLLQIMVALFLAGSLTVKQWWFRLKSFFVAAPKSLPEGDAGNGEPPAAT